MDNQKTDRRDFFRKVTRLAFLSAMMGGSAYLLSEKRVQMDGCSDNQFCRNCRKVTTCPLDQAINFRKNER